MTEDDPHAGQPVLRSGAEIGEARGVAIMIHGRGATAESILALAEAFGQPDLAYVAPQAAARTWYPYPFMSPIEINEPWLSSALTTIGRLVGQLGATGIPPERVALIGFSQGACLALEFSVRNPRRYGAVIGLSGGLIGPDVTEWPRRGSLAATPAFIGCSDVDAHIPLARVRRSAEVLRAMDAEVTQRLYPGMGHTVNDDEIAHVRRLLAGIGGEGGGISAGGR